MKRLNQIIYPLVGIAMLTALLNSCLPNLPELKGSRPSSDTVQYEASLSGLLIVSTSTTFFNHSEACSPIGEFLDRVSCPAPGTYQFQTYGATSAQIIDGWLPLTRPVKVEASQ